MGGTRSGGLKARDTNLKKYGKNFYVRIGSVGGKISRTGGFGSTFKGKDGLTGRERARVAGVAGGIKSRRGAKPKKATAWIADDGKPFSDGFNQPSVMDRTINKLKNHNT